MLKFVAVEWLGEILLGHDESGPMLGLKVFVVRAAANFIALRRRRCHGIWNVACRDNTSNTIRRETGWYWANRGASRPAVK